MNKLNKIALALTAALTLGMNATTASAGSLAGQLNTQMVLQASCIISGAPGAGSSGVNMGTLDFGTQPSTFTGAVNATSTGSAGGAGATQILCSPDIASLSVTVGAGNNAGQGASIGTGARAMKLGTSSYLPYEVYSDAAHTSAYPTSATPVGITMPGTGAAIGLPIYGRINKTSANAITSGTYSDVLQVTLSW